MPDAFASPGERLPRMERVLVLGSGGAGKSTFARRLARCTGLPLVHLDALYWRAGWVETPRSVWEDRVRSLLAADRWILDGNYGGTLDMRLAACDTVVFLDTPRLLCIRRVLVRRVRSHGRSRPDMAEGCPERLSAEFLRWIWEYPARRRGAILQRLEKLDPPRRAVVLRGEGEIDAFLAINCRGGAS